MPDAEYEPVMPFVTTEPAGPHEARSYVAGFEMGSLDAHLTHLAATDIGVTTLVLNIHTENQAMADLIAMRHGFDLTYSEIPEFPEWISLQLTRAAIEAGGHA